MDEKQLRREIALAITNLRGVKLVSFLCEYCTRIINQYICRQESHNTVIRESIL